MENNLKQNYREYTDKYFLRTKQILEAENINPIVRYQVFARKGGEVRGVDEAVGFVKDVAGNKAKVYALKDKENYAPCEPLMKIEGRVQDLVDLETVYLGLISSGLTGKIDLNEVRNRAREIKAAAENKPVFYFGARHFSPFLDKDIAKICQEQGFVGASTDIGGKAWNRKGLGTIPHALILSYTANILEKRKFNLNPTVEAAKAFDRVIDPSVPRIVLIDTFNREIYDSIETAKAVPSIKGMRIDTCGENYTEGSQYLKLPELNVSEKYLRGKGVTIASVWALRQGLDNAGFGNLELTVSSGFNSEKTKAFLEADKVYNERFGKPLFDSIGTGSIADPVMATSDIVAYFRENRNQWQELHKKGRPEILTDRLMEVK